MKTSTLTLEIRMGPNVLTLHWSSQIVLETVTPRVGRGKQVAEGEGDTLSTSVASCKYKPHL